MYVKTDPWSEYLGPNEIKTDRGKVSRMKNFNAERLYESRNFSNTHIKVKN